ncbi:MAG: hypothetical protein QOI41_2825, partial [Myxococcales bacterium]|nr:hypothetical protein [Myxococcales bacterium]
MAMRGRLSLSLVVAGAALAIAGCRPQTSTSTSASAIVPSPHAPFAVAIVVDQLSAWVAASRWPELPEDGGFARLRREGTWVKNMRYPYAVTDTAPGHAALHTGQVPADSGIVGNELPDGAGDRFTILRDDTTRTVTPAGVRATPSSSAALLRADTVADRLRAARPDALVVSISLKDRAAILSAGKHPTHALWFDAAQDSFVTSTAFEAGYPRWASALSDPRAVAKARRLPWELGDRAWVAEHSAGPDEQPGEGDLDGLGTTFPHVARTGASFRALPASDGMILDLALAAIDAEYDASKPTLLLLSMSASDVIGHVFGPDSWEAWDHLRKLDARLALLLDALDRRVGKSVPVLLAGDHGNLSMPEISPARAGVSCPSASGSDGKMAAPDPYGRPCATGVRLEPRALELELAAATRAALGGGEWIRGLADPYLFLTPAGRALTGKRRAVLDDVIRRTLGKHQDGLADVIDARTLAAECPDVRARSKAAPARARIGEDVITLVCRAWSPLVGAGDYYLVPRVGSSFDGEIVRGKGASHGSPSVYDRTVPMLVRAPRVIDAGAMVDDPVDFSVFAALEAAFVGLDQRAP